MELYSGIIYTPGRRDTALLDLDDNLVRTRDVAEKMGVGEEYREARGDPSPADVVTLHSRVFSGKSAEEAGRIVGSIPSRPGAERLVNALHKADYEVWAVTNNPVAPLAADHLKSRFGFDGMICSHEAVVKGGEVTGEIRYHGPKEEQARKVVRDERSADAQVVTDEYDSRFAQAMEEEGAQVHVVREGDSLGDLAKRFWRKYMAGIV